MQSRAALRLPGLQCAAVCRPGKASPPPGISHHSSPLKPARLSRNCDSSATGRPVAPLALPERRGGTGDVEVRPVVLAGEARQETAGGDRAAGDGRQCSPYRQNWTPADPRNSSASGKRHARSPASSEAPISSWASGLWFDIRPVM